MKKSLVNSMNLQRKLGGLLLATLVIGAMFTLGGCRQAPSRRVLGLAQIEISGYGVVEVPEGVEVIHRNWVHPENRIVLTFNKDLDPKQDLELLMFITGRTVVVYPFESTAEHKYLYYRVLGRTLTISHVDKERGGLPTFFVTLVLPTELRALDGTLLNEDTFVWLSTSRSSPQSLVMIRDVGQEDKSLILPVWGREDGRRVAYMLENSFLYTAPSKEAETLTELGLGENVRVLSIKGEWAEVMVYYPKYHFHEPALDRLASDFDVWTSDLVRRVRGYLPQRSLQVIPRPRKASSAFSVTYGYWGHDDVSRVIAVELNGLPHAVGAALLVSGGILTQERLDFLEVDALLNLGWHTAGRSWGSSYGRAGVVGSLSFHDPYIHHPFHTWTPAQYSRFLEIRKAYLARLESYWDAYLVTPAYSDWKERFRDLFRREARMQDVWTAWGAEDKDLRIETFARKVADEFGETSAEKDRIFTLITQQSTLNDNVGWLEVLTAYVSLLRDKDFALLVQERKQALFYE
ncbi:MAG: hypothetical protein DDT34_02253 [Firmicutes bacterium]|nr:hypothetical protein [Bacillota bacterium]